MPERGIALAPLREKCYACGEQEMVEIQVCKYRCNNCGALLDCEDVSGLPK